MKRKLFYCLCTTLLFSCEKSEPELKEEQVQTQCNYEIALDESFTIELESNPTTGYGWKWTNSLTAQKYDSITATYVSDTPTLIGTGGKEVWTFKGVERGLDSIKMLYCRPSDSIGLYDTTLYIKVN